MFLTELFQGFREFLDFGIFFIGTSDVVKLCLIFKVKEVLLDVAHWTSAVFSCALVSRWCFFHKRMILDDIYWRHDIFFSRFSWYIGWEFLWSNKNLIRLSLRIILSGMSNVFSAFLMQGIPKLMLFDFILGLVEFLFEFSFKILNRFEWVGQGTYLPLLLSYLKTEDFDLLIEAWDLLV